MSDDHQMKLAFAEALLVNPEDAFQAAFSIEGDPGKCLKMVNEWVKDSIVVDEMLKLEGERGPDGFLPSKNRVARMLFDDIENCKDPSERRKMIRDYSELRGFIAKPATGEVNLNMTTSGVMVLRSSGNDDAWEETLAAQQKKLVEDASA